MLPIIPQSKRLYNEHAIHIKLLAAQGLRKSGIDRVLNDQFARAMRDDNTGAALRSAAGGIEDAYYASIPGMSDDLGSRRRRRCRSNAECCL